MAGELKEKVFSNFIWRLCERYLVTIVQFIVSIVLARILMPEMYGTIALVTVFISILQVFVDSGLGNALIQKKDADDTDFSTVFYFNIFFCTILYVIIFLLAPFIAKFYKDVNLIPVIRVLSLSLIISGLKNVQQAYVSRTLQFKKFFWSTLGGTLISAVVGILLAKKGFGVWALVAQNLTNAFIDTLILWITVKWRPTKKFSKKRFNGLFGYGSKLLASSLLDTGYTNLRKLIIGKKYSSSDLAYYEQGEKFPYAIVTNINSSIDSVLLPTMSKEQEHKQRVKDMTRRAIKTSSYIMAPMMLGLAVVAPSVVKLILTDKWLFCVPYLQIFCVDYLFFPIHTANLNAIRALGRSDIFLKLEIVKKVIGITIILISVQFGVLAVALSCIVTTIFSLIINSYPNNKLIKYSLGEQLKDIFSNIFIAIIMAVCVWGLSFININYVILLCIQVLVGIAIYIALSIIFKNDTFYYLIGILRNFINKRTNIEDNQMEKKLNNSRLGIMQPYFMPYLGYFALIKHTDAFVFFDTPQYIKRGWVNRNRIIHQQENFNYINIPLKKAPQETAIKDMLIDDSQDWKKKIFAQLEIYKKKSPYYEDVINLLHETLDKEYKTIGEINIAATIAVCKYLGIDKPFYIYSEMDLNIPQVNAPDEWALYITKAMGYKTYINPPGGMTFFNYAKYEKENIELKFLKINLTPYVQKRGYFEPGLSIVDVMMFNSKEKIMEMLDDITLINGKEYENKEENEV